MLVAYVQITSLDLTDNLLSWSFEVMTIGYGPVVIEVYIERGGRELIDKRYVLTQDAYYQEKDSMSVDSAIQCSGLSPIKMEVSEPHAKYDDPQDAAELDCR